MDRELLLELGTEEIPAAWLPGLTRQIGERVAARLSDNRLSAGAPIETYSTPRRLTVRIAKVSERQADKEETIVGPPVGAAYDAAGGPTPAAVGFARKHGVEVADLTRTDTPRGPYLAYQKRERNRAAVDVLPDVLAGTLRDLTFPKLMKWDALLEDGRGELPFGRPIRWILFLYGGRVVPFTIRRTALALTAQVQDVRSGAVTYGHRFLATSGRPGRSIKVRSFDDYQARLAEHFVVLERTQRQDRIARELDAQARRLGGRVLSRLGQTGPLDEVPDLVEYPSVVAGTFALDFLELPDEVLTTTLIHHQHYFPVVDDEGKLKPAFLAVVNTQLDNGRTIARNAERVVGARLRDARFFWQADRKVPLDARLDRLDTLLFHKELGSYRAKAERLASLARFITTEAFGAPDAADAASRAALLAKTDLTTDMVREFTELQGVMGGVYARHAGEPEAVWKAVYYQYEPTAVEAESPPARQDLGAAAVSWAAVSLADKLDTLTGLFYAGEQPTGSRDPFALRRQAHGVVRILADLPELTGIDRAIALRELIDTALGGWAPSAQEWPAALRDFLIDRLRHLFERRGFRYDEIKAVLSGPRSESLRVLDLLRRLRALQAVRGSSDFATLAVLFKRVKNIARELPASATAEEWDRSRDRLVEPSEVALLAEYDHRAPEIRGALEQGDYRRALTHAAALRPAVDKFFADVFVMVDDVGLRTARLALMVRLRDLILDIADIAELASETPSALE